MNLILLQLSEVQAALASGGALELPAGDRRARHVASVLRPTPGASVRVGVLGGSVGRVGVEVLGDGAVRLAALPGEAGLNALASPAPPRMPHVELLLAMPRPKVLMRLWSQIAQLGVRRVVLTNAYRVEKPYFSSQAVDPQRFQPELLEGLEQAVCTHLPEVQVEMRLKPFIEDSLDRLCPPDVLRLLCHPGDGSSSVADAVASVSRGGPQRTPPRALLLAIGPEGGWVDYELDLLRAHGFVQVSLGPRVFSTDVALIALVTLAVDALVSAGRAARREPGRLASPGAEAPCGRALEAARASAWRSAPGRRALLAQAALGALCFLLGSSLRRPAAPAATGRG